MEIELVNNEDHSYSCNECGVTNYENPRKQQVDKLYKFFIGTSNSGRIGVILCEKCLNDLTDMISDELIGNEMCGICSMKIKNCTCAEMGRR